jgi:glycerol-3-phosphate dehydrogenase
LTLVGGKLTTSRIFGEKVADMVFERLGVRRTAGTMERMVPGGEGIPSERSALATRWQEMGKQYGLQLEQVRAMWALCGSRLEDILRMHRDGDREPLRNQSVAGTQLPRTFVRWVIQHEWAQRIEDLVERRLMLIYEPALCQKTLLELADLLQEAGRLEPGKKEAAIADAVIRIQTAYGRVLGHEAVPEMTRHSE